jgi:ribosomal protein L11 methyltransferase
MSYHRVTVFNVGEARRTGALQELAMDRFSCQGIEEYSMDEAEVDALLGTRSYSGGDLPLEVLNEVDQAMHDGPCHFKFFFADEDLSQAQNFLVTVKASFLCEAQLETFGDQDWNAEWKKHYHPIEVEGGLVILPEWELVEKYEQKTVVRIHPGMGFGTGSHETTFLCLKHFLKLTRELTGVDEVLDYGSGSGILGLAALIYKPEWKAGMVDIDPEAHRNCLQNMALNGISQDRVQLLLLDKRPTTQTYPIVFANILQNILHEERDYLIERTRPEGFLILSGLLAVQLDETRSHYLSTSRVELASEEVLRDWSCLVLRRKP